MVNRIGGGCAAERRGPSPTGAKTSGRRFSSEFRRQLCGKKGRWAATDRPPIRGGGTEPEASDLTGRKGTYPRQLVGESERPVRDETEQELERVVDFGASWGPDCHPAASPGLGVCAPCPPDPGAGLGTQVRIAEIERILGRLARRVAWGGDGLRGCARIELELGGLAGGVLVVHADRRDVDVELQLPPGESAEAWRSRLRGRLEARGISVGRFDVY